METTTEGLGFRCMRWPPSALLTAQLGECAADFGREIHGLILRFTGIFLGPCKSKWKLLCRVLGFRVRLLCAS